MLFFLERAKCKHLVVMVVLDEEDWFVRHYEGTPCSCSGSVKENVAP